MVQITGEAEFNEVFFDNVKVPIGMRVGEEGQGWMIAITTLMFERTVGDATMAAAYESNMRVMLEMAKTTQRAGRPVIENPVFRQQLAQAYIEVMVLKYHGFRSLSHQLQGGIPGPGSHREDPLERAEPEDLRRRSQHAGSEQPDPQGDTVVHPGRALAVRVPPLEREHHRGGDIGDPEKHHRRALP